MKKRYIALITLCSLVVFGYVGAVVAYNSKPITQTVQQPGQLVLDITLDTPLPAPIAPAPTVDELLAETNKARTDNGLQPLVLDERLNVTAQAKCQDMLERNYWSHDTPDGAEPWQMIDAHGILYQTAGENLAYGYENAKATVNGWMNSPGHKANIVNTTFTNIGFGICKIDRPYQKYTTSPKDGYIIAQHFILTR